MPSDTAITEPTFSGFVDSTYDALVLFEACLQRRVHKITRRLHEKERHLIKSGSIFVFDERESGIKRWTDNLLWSPSRILGNFLIYRELDKKETQSAANTNALAHGAVEEAPTMLGNSDPSLRGGDPSTAISRERALLGSLTSSYKFKLNGLVKKTISVSGMHMICYYRVNDVIGGRLRSPSSLPELATLDISSQLLTNQNFRVPPKIDIGPDGQARYVGELEENGANGQASLTVPTPGSRRRSSSADKPQSSRAAHQHSSESSEDAVAPLSAPMRPSNLRSKSSSSQRYEPYLRTEPPAQAYNMPINLQESSRRRNSQPWPVAHFSADVHSSAYGQSASSPVESNSSGGYEMPQYATYQPPSSQAPVERYQASYEAGAAFEDPLIAFRNYQAAGGHAPPVKSNQYRHPPPLQQFQLPPENSSMRSTALRSPYYSQSPRSSPSYQPQYQSLQRDASAPQEERSPGEHYDQAYPATAMSPSHSPSHYPYQPAMASPHNQPVTLPPAYPDYADYSASSAYHVSGLVAPAYQDPAAGRVDGQRQSFQDWSAQMAEAQWRAAA